MILHDTEIFNLRRRKERIALSHDSEFKPVTITSLEKFKFDWKIFEQSRFDVPVSRNVGSYAFRGKSSWQLSLFDTYDTDTRWKERLTRYVQELLVAEYETDGSMKLLMAKI